MNVDGFERQPTTGECFSDLLSRVSRHHHQMNRVSRFLLGGHSPSPVFTRCTDGMGAMLMLSVLVLAIGCGGRCPEGFSKDSDGNCIQLGVEDAEIDLTGIWNIELLSGAFSMEGNGYYCDGTWYEEPGGDRYDYYCNVTNGNSFGNAWLVEHVGTTLYGYGHPMGGALYGFEQGTSIGTVEAGSVELYVDTDRCSYFGVPTGIVASGAVVDAATIDFTSWWVTSSWCDNSEEEYCWWQCEGDLARWTKVGEYEFD